MEAERERRRKVTELTDYIDTTIAAEVKAAKTPQEEAEAYSIGLSIVQVEVNELDHLRQSPLVARLKSEGVLIPDEYWHECDYWMKPLTNKGETWVRGEVKRLQRATIEFWFKLVLPIVALVISIVALLKKH